MHCRVRGPIVEDEPRDIKLLWKKKVSDLLREGRHTEILCFEGVEPILGEASNFHILPDHLLDLMVKPLPQVPIVLRLLAQPLGSFIQMVATRAFVTNSVTPFVIQDVP